ncbi:MAG: UDP-N-acetylmuramoyl-L-alanine--D-glutamate ligase [Cyclobacteriaceae bacterium]|nr:UDP-N-acetylmuramoyl-L-alanine--D-glutamate ligase [Cyclobacteriaceae bacterium]
MKERLVILGAGESGTGAALLAKAKGYDVFVSDAQLIKENFKQELMDNHIPFEEGQHAFDLIQNAKLVIKSPGIPDKAPIVKEIKANRIEIIDELEFAFRYYTGKVIAITGTNGKTTTTLLTYHILKEAGYTVGLAGNVGKSMARQLLTQQADWYVVEISSFQLDGTQSFQPEIAILLNITPDHLDRYEYEMKNYIDSKFRITRNMQSSQAFIYYADDAILAKEVSSRAIASQIIPVSLTQQNFPVHYNGSEMVFGLNAAFKIKQTDTTLKGPHNLINTMAAVSAATIAGVKEEDIRKALSNFVNAPHRLEKVATINGVEFVNDSKATNVDSVVYALGSYAGNLIWIAGGIDKGNDYSLIEKDVKAKVHTLICLGKDNSKLKNFFGDKVKNILETQYVKELVRMALNASKVGDVVLLSPACASFDLFKNYEDRGTQFRNAVLELKREVERTKDLKVTTKTPQA